MRRNIFHDKINTAYGNRTKLMSFLITSFEEILNCFKLRNCWLNFKPSRHKFNLSHSEENAYVFFVKKETLQFVIEHEIRFIGKL